METERRTKWWGKGKGGGGGYLASGTTKAAHLGIASPLSRHPPTIHQDPLVPLRVHHGGHKCVPAAVHTFNILNESWSDLGYQWSGISGVWRAMWLEYVKRLRSINASLLVALSEANYQSDLAGEGGQGFGGGGVIRG